MGAGDARPGPVAAPAWDRRADAGAGTSRDCRRGRPHRARRRAAGSAEGVRRPAGRRRVDGGRGRPSRSSWWPVRARSARAFRTASTPKRCRSACSGIATTCPTCSGPPTLPYSPALGGPALVAQEALRAGVPLVATAVGGVPELVGMRRSWCRAVTPRPWRRRSSPSSTMPSSPNGSVPREASARYLAGRGRHGGAGSDGLRELMTH